MRIFEEELLNLLTNLSCCEIFLKILHGYQNIPMSVRPCVCPGFKGLPIHAYFKELLKKLSSRSLIRLTIKILQAI